MGEMIPLYGFGGKSGRAASALTITAPVGATVTVSKDGKSKPSKVATTGTVVFNGLETGTWTITITNGTDTATKTVEIKADYSAEIAFFSATINVTYPAGLACTATNGSTTLTAPDTSGTWACTVPKAGTWTVLIQKGDAQGQEAVQITAEHQTVSVTLALRMYFIRDGAIQPGVNIETKNTSGASPNVSTLDGYVQLSTGGNGNVIFFVSSGQIRAYNSLHLKTNRMGGQRSYYNKTSKEIPTMRIISGTPVIPTSSNTIMQNVVATTTLNTGGDPANMAGLDVDLPYNASDNALNALVYIGGSKSISGTSGAINITDWWVEYYEDLS